MKKQSLVTIAAAALGVLAVGAFLLPHLGAHAAWVFTLIPLAAVTANQVLQRQDGNYCKALVAASTTIYDGTFCFFNATGYADDDTASGVNRFAGIARQYVDNSGGSAGDLAVELWTEGIFLLTGATFAQTSVGLPVYATDNYTLTLNGGASGAVYIGIIHEYVSSTTVRVAIKTSDRKEVKSVAAAGSAQGDAAQLTGCINTVSAADGTKGVILPPASAGKVIYVYNEHATNGLKVYPASGDDINDGTADAAVVTEGKLLATFVGLDGATWAAAFTANS